MVPPDGFWVDDEGLWARGWLDTLDSVGARLYRMLKRGTLQWSLGFRTAKARPGNDGVRVLEEVDELLELSAVAIPANERTRTASVKSETTEAPTLAELREHERRLGLLDRDDDGGIRRRRA